MRKINTPLNFDHSQVKGETNNLPSLTVPDQSLSLKQLLINHTRGIPSPHFTPIWNGEDPLPDINKMDLTEIADYKRSLDTQIQDLKDEVETVDKGKVPKHWTKTKSPETIALEKISKTLEEKPLPEK